MPKGLEVPHLPIATMILFVNISNLFEVKIYLHMAWILDMILCFSMQWEDTIEPMNGKCDVFTFLHARGNYSWGHTNVMCHLCKL